MADESDGMNDAVEGHLRIGLTLATRTAEVLAQIVAERAREAAAASQDQARQLTARLEAERAAARASVDGVGTDQWWERAQPEQIAAAWQTTQTWKGLDTDLAGAGEKIAEQVAARYGVDVERIDPDLQALRRALAEREGAEQEASAQRAAARGQDVEAVVLMVDADAADRQGQPERAQQVEQSSEVAYDSAERRQALAARLEKVASPDAVQARVLTDIAHAKPPHDAVNGKVSSSGPRRVAPREVSLGAEQVKSMGR